MNVIIDAKVNYEKEDKTSERRGKKDILAGAFTIKNSNRNDGL